MRLPCFVYFGLYRTLIRYISYTDIWNVLKAISTSSLLFIGLTFLFDFRTLPRSVLFIDGLCLFVCMTAVRLGLRLFRERQGRSQTAEEKKRRVFIFGAGNAGALVFRCLRASQEAYEVIGFLDDDPAKRHKTLYGHKVLGNRFNLEALVKLYQAHEVLLAVPSAPARDIAAIIQACQNAGVPYRFFPTLSEGWVPETIQTLFKVAVFYHEINDYTGARQRYERVRLLAERTLGPSHPFIFEVLVRLAVVLSEGFGDYAGAARLNAQLLARTEQTFGPDDPRLTLPLGNLALDLRPARRLRRREGPCRTVPGDCRAGIRSGAPRRC